MSRAQAQQDVKEFLVSRRARRAPGDVGLPDLGGLRRVPGLRRQEVADLAAVSLDYYTQLERGHVRGASDVVLTALMDALRLSAIERGYFLDLVRQVNASGRPPRHGARADMPPGLQQMADAMAEVTVLVRNHRMDVIGGNARAKALYAPVYAEPSPNLSRHVFRDPAARTFSPDRERMADINVGTLRLALARYPDDADLIALVDELAAANADFRERWPQHPVMQFGSGTKVFDHLTVGRMALQHEQLRLVADVTLVVNVYSAAPGSIDAQRFAALG